MPYDILFSDHALDRVAAAHPPDQVIDGLERHLQWLADDPINRGRKSIFPYPPKGQICPFHLHFAGFRYNFVVFFYYGQNEQSIKVFDVTINIDPSP
jgi:hypothetical protein